MTTMRLATFDDLRRAAEIGAEAFINEPIMAYRYPGRFEYPDDWFDFWYYLVRDSILEPNRLLYVLEVDNSATGGSDAEMVAVLGWMMMGEDYPNPAGLPWKKDSPDLQALREKEAQKEKEYRATHVDRAIAEPSKLASFASIMKQSVADHWLDSSGKLIPHWRVQYVATLPAYQGNGYGSQLLKWGLDQADRDGMVVGVNAGKVGLNLYERYGFVNLGDVRFGDSIGFISRREPRVTAE